MGLMNPRYFKKRDKMPTWDFYKDEFASFNYPILEDGTIIVLTEEAKQAMKEDSKTIQEYKEKLDKWEKESRKNCRVVCNCGKCRIVKRSIE